METGFRFKNGKWFYTYTKDGKNLWTQLTESNDPILKRYVIYLRGFHQYAAGITGARHWSILFAGDGSGWRTSTEARDWMKANHKRNYSRKSKDPVYGVGAEYENYKVLRLDRYIQFITGKNSWYEKATCQIPNYATTTE